VQHTGGLRVDTTRETCFKIPICSSTRLGGAIRVGVAYGPCGVMQWLGHRSVLVGITMRTEQFLAQQDTVNLVQLQ
jgi:hypothetical protein